MTQQSEEGRFDADEALVPTRLVLDDAAFCRVVELLERAPAPTEALRKLMRPQPSDII